MRKRNALLQALLLLKDLDGRISVNEIIAFLYTCENEGLNVQELAFVASLSQTTASRSARALGPRGLAWSLAPELDLVHPSLNPSDGRSHILHLTARGREVRDRIDKIIREGVTISAGAADEPSRQDREVFPNMTIE